MTITLSVIVATSGRATLDRTLASLTPQLADGDELLVLRRDSVPWGNATRDEAIARAAGTHLWWMDDDDIATPDAFDTIRRTLEPQPDAVHIFRMTYYKAGGTTLWADPVVRFANIGGTMVVVPNVPGKLGSWVHEGNTPPGAGGDFHFLTGTLALRGEEPVFHDEVIAVIKPT